MIEILFDMGKASAAVVVSAVVLLIYCVAQGYHHDPELMATVAVIRLGVAYGLGAIIAFAPAIWFLAMKREHVLATFVTATMFSGSLIVIVLASFNLLSGT